LTKTHTVSSCFNLEIDSDELKSNSEDDDEMDDVNNHGFLEPEELKTYRLRRREKRDLLKNQEKEEYKPTRKQKTGGKSNKEKLKNKPMMMVLGKRKREQKIKVESLNKKIKKIKQQLGRYKVGNIIKKKKGGNTRKK
jgi:hypothetical protein